jgi:Mn2+/Fe2+ NRAMP family transporter
MKRIALLARIIETIILAPLLFLILSQMGDRIIESFIMILVCVFSMQWIRTYIVTKVNQHAEIGNNRHCATKTLTDKAQTETAKTTPTGRNET